MSVLLGSVENLYLSFEEDHFLRASDAVLLVVLLGGQTSLQLLSRHCRSRLLPRSQDVDRVFLADGAEGARLYYEPHCSYVRSSVRRGLAQVGGRVDVCVTPVRSVDVAGFALVAGGGAAADLVEALGTPRLVG